MIDHTHQLPVTLQVELLDVSRGSVYYLPKPVSESDLRLMRHIDELHLEHPLAGSRMLCGLLCQEGSHVGRKHMAILMRKMGIGTLYRRPNTSRKLPGHPIYPYLLRHPAVTRPNQAWAMDITCIPMRKGFVYLAAVIDWRSRKVLAFRVSITMETDFYIEAVEEAIRHYGIPEICNPDQGSQFMSEAFTGLLKQHDIRISMDGKEVWSDNVFVERLWKSVNYEEVYINAHNTVSEARTSIGQYFEFYNRRRPHSSLDRMAPEQFYFNSPPVHKAA